MSDDLIIPTTADVPDFKTRDEVIDWLMEINGEHRATELRVELKKDFQIKHLNQAYEWIANMPELHMYDWTSFDVLEQIRQDRSVFANNCPLKSMSTYIVIAINHHITDKYNLQNEHYNSFVFNASDIEEMDNHLDELLSHYSNSQLLQAYQDVLADSHGCAWAEALIWSQLEKIMADLDAKA